MDEGKGVLLFLYVTNPEMLMDVPDWHRDDFYPIKSERTSLTGNFVWLRLFLIPSFTLADLTTPKTCRILIAMRKWQWARQKRDIQC